MVFATRTMRWDDLYDLVSFVQSKKHEKHPWKNATFSKVAGFRRQLYTKTNTPSWLSFAFFKLYKWHQIAQNIKS